MEFTQYALNDRGEITSINDPLVLRGLQCECTCPCCGCAMVARKGDVRRHHFAHHSEQPRECYFAFETELHILAKVLIEQEKRICLPVSFSKAGENQSCEIFPVTNVRIEKFHLGRKPDLIVDIDGYDYVIEIAVTHFCDPAKVMEYRRKSINAAEFDLSTLRGEDDLEAALKEALFTDCTNYAYWLSLLPMNGIGQLAMQQLRTEAEKLTQVVTRGRQNDRDLKRTLSELQSKINQGEDELSRLLKSVGALKDLTSVNREMLAQKRKLAALRAEYADESKVIERFVQQDAELQRVSEKITRQRVKLSEESQSINRQRTSFYAETKEHRAIMEAQWDEIKDALHGIANIENAFARDGLDLVEIDELRERIDKQVAQNEVDVKQQWSAIRDALHEIANIENALALEGLTLKDIRKLGDRFKQQANYEDLFARRKNLMELELKKQEEKQTRIQNNISELLKQKDYYQAEVARLSRAVKNTAN